MLEETRVNRGRHGAMLMRAVRLPAARSRLLEVSILRIYAALSSRGWGNSKSLNHREPPRRPNSVALFAIIAVLGLGCAGDARAAHVKDWSFLQNSYWYVPTPNLPALLSSVEDGGTVVPIVDQTVFYIKTYKSGYFWGTVATDFTSSSGSNGPNCFFLVASVTPEGAVNLSFSPTGSSGVPTTGIGTMRFRDKQWEMENQMSTSVSSGTVSHWAYMVQCHPGQPCMESLPGTSLTISQLLSPCD